MARFGAAGSKGSQVGSMYMDASTRMLAQQVCGWLGVGSRQQLQKYAHQFYPSRGVQRGRPPRSGLGVVISTPPSNVTMRMLVLPLYLDALLPRLGGCSRCPPTPPHSLCSVLPMTTPPAGIMDATAVSRPTPHTAVSWFNPPIPALPTVQGAPATASAEVPSTSVSLLPAVSLSPATEPFPRKLVEKIQAG